MTTCKTLEEEKKKREGPDLACQKFLGLKKIPGLN